MNAPWRTGRFAMQIACMRRHLCARAPWIVLLIVLACTAWFARRLLIRSLFVDGPAVVDHVPSSGTEHQPHPVPAFARVRVVLLDGLDARVADTLPALQRLCGAGWSLGVDVGFPTVSLPVQHVLWTGLTQRQSGVQYRQSALETVPGYSLPLQRQSVAVASAHPEIVQSFGFTAVAVPPTWDAFAAEARRAVASSVPLVFIHVLEIDAAGHARGRESAEYRDAANAGDALLAELLRADTGDVASTQWWVLSDHGHRAKGGHGDAESALRVVRACSRHQPAGIDTQAGVPHVRLVDLARTLRDELGVAPVAGARGVPLAQAVTLSMSLPSTLPQPTVMQWVTACMIVGVGLMIAIVGVRRAWWALPCWPWVAYAGVVVFGGVPSLSDPRVWPPFGWTLLLHASPGLLALALQSAWQSSRQPGQPGEMGQHQPGEMGQHQPGEMGRPGQMRQHGTRRVLVTQMIVPVALVAATAVLSGAAGVVLGTHAGPPLMPWWTAHASTACLVFAAGALVLGLQFLLAAVYAGYHERRTS